MSEVAVTEQTVEETPSEERNSRVAAATQSAADVAANIAAAGAERLKMWRRHKAARRQNTRTRSSTTQTQTRVRALVPSLFTGPRLAAMIVWLVGVSATATALVGMGVKIGATATISAMALQLVFTVIERPLWRGSKYGFIGFACIGFDAWFNFGGVWPFAKNIDKTPSWAYSVEALNMQSAPPDAIRVGFALIVSIAIAGAVEWLWFMED